MTSGTKVMQISGRPECFSALRFDLPHLFLASYNIYTDEMVHICKVKNGSGSDLVYKHSSFVINSGLLFSISFLKNIDTGFFFPSVINI